MGDKHKIIASNPSSDRIDFTGSVAHDMQIIGINNFSSFQSDTISIRSIHIMITFEGEIAHESNGRISYLGPGDILIVSSGEHSKVNWKANCRVLCVRIEQSVVDECLKSISRIHMKVPVLFSPYSSIGGAFGAQMSRFVGVMLAETSLDDADFRTGLTSSHWARLIAITLLKLQPNRILEFLNSDSYDDIPSFLNQIIQYIDLNLDKDICRDDLVRECGVSARTLHFWFNKIFRVGPMTYVREARLHNVREQLARSSSLDASVGDVAAQWGFYDASRFASVYRRYFGELPSETLRRSA